MLPLSQTQFICHCFTGGKVRVNWCSCSCLRRLFEFFAQAKTGADHTNNKLPLSQEWRRQSNPFNINAVHAT